MGQPVDIASDGIPTADRQERPGRAGSASPGGDSRAGDEQVAVWLDDYTRLRDRIARSGEAAPGRQGRSASAELDLLRARIASHYTGLIESVARRFAYAGEPLEDLVQEGFLGLLSALNNYDSGKGVKFSTYATHFIAGAMRHCLRDRGKIIKEPAWLNELSGKINRVSDALTQSLGRAPHAAEIAAALNLTEESVEEILSTRQVFQVASLEWDGSEGDSDFAGVVAPERIRSDKMVTLQLPIEDRIVLEGAIDKLKALEQKVLYEFFYKDLNQSEIARKLDISCNYASHILKNSTKKLRRILGEAEVTDRGRQRTASIVDAATGLYTETHILGRLDEEISRARRGEYPLAVLVLALADLPARGSERDDLLAVTGSKIRNLIRRVDVAGRLRCSSGSEGFILILPHTGAQASIIEERLRLAFVEMAAAQESAFSVTIGSAVYPDEARNPDHLIDIARSREPIAPDVDLQAA